MLAYAGSSRVASVAPLPGAHRVYNLEVQGLHNFLVGELGVVVHNNYGIAQALVNGIFNATSHFHGNFKCQGFSKALRTYFKSNGVEVKSKRVQLFNKVTGRNEATVIGFDMPNGSTIQIATNGFHEFTIINGKIFDNNFPAGLEMNDFWGRMVFPPGLGVKKIDIFD